MRWAHLDIAGPAFNDAAPHGYTPKGGTGQAVRTLVRIAEDLAAGGHHGPEPRNGAGQHRSTGCGRTGDGWVTWVTGPDGWPMDG